MSNFNKILEKYRKLSYSERDKGERFERLIKAFLENYPLYKNQLQKVWMWEDFPGRQSMGGKDLGIDLVALTFDDSYWSIQCKCYAKGTSINEAAVTNFIANSNRSFIDEQGKTQNFSFCLWVDTTEGGFTSNALQTFSNQSIQTRRLGFADLYNAEIDWEKLDNGIYGQQSLTEIKKLRDHQNDALEAANKYFTNHDRGKLIMACGTGKTFTSLRIVEKLTDSKGTILYLVPSIALLSQALKEWSHDAQEKINAICICSDSEATRFKSKDEDSNTETIVDLAMPACTDVASIKKQFTAAQALQEKEKSMTVVFSTYQSIDVISKAQKAIGPNAIFDFIVCDEAHRTTGVTLAGNEESAFVRVHDKDYIQANYRIYMTATPRIYAESAQTKARENNAVMCSMDDPAYYGEEIYRIGFGEAVKRDLLSDYKVLVLTLSEDQISKELQNSISSKNSEINTDDATKLIGCINALSKKTLSDNKILKESDPQPMRRAVAFSQNIKISKETAKAFNSCQEAYFDYLTDEQRKEIVKVSADHVDGSMGASKRDEKLRWLKEAPQDSNECRVLSNVRCLSEGIDVPSLDAVLFLSARNSQVDVVQSVGRVMRKAPGKKYGYIIIPVVIPSGISPEEALNDNDRFKVVWTVLNALRAHDDRFNAIVNKIELNKKKPSNIIIGGTTFGDGETEYIDDETRKKIEEQLTLKFAEFQSVIYARMVQKVGNRRYWEQWAGDIAKIAERHIQQINKLISTNQEAKKYFDEFLKGLRKNINPSVPEETAIEMLAQHFITKPVFEALFDNYSFADNNPMSKSLGKMVNLLNEHFDEEDHKSLERFYDSVKERAEGIDNAESKQKVIVELYDNFFKLAFPKVVEQLGIVYTPVDCVDFIIHSVEYVLKQEFGRSMSDANVNIIDPFTGTGTFITRLLQSGIIRKEDLQRKYQKEIFANEIVLLAYYIASINIENVFHDLINAEKYLPFNGICLTDTFQIGEQMYHKKKTQTIYEYGEKSFAPNFPENSSRITKQLKQPITVVIGNPPYSVGQKSANDNAQNQSYKYLDERIEEMYVKSSKAALNKAAYDSYIRAFRWATDRIDHAADGIIGFISNGSWLDSNGLDGFRKSLQSEFYKIYIFNLRGNQRASGELSRKEGGKIFGSGSRTPIAITILVKKANNTEPAQIFYHDIGDYLSREDKLRIIKEFHSIKSLPLVELHPNAHGDWINLRKDTFSNFLPIQPEKKFDLKSKSWFNTYVIGVATNRDAWVYNFSKEKITANMKGMIDFYNQQVLDLKNEKISDFENDAQKISWTRALKKDATQHKSHTFDASQFRTSCYRPFCKQNLYYHRPFIESPGLWSQIFPTENSVNFAIMLSGVGSSKDFSCLITSQIPSLDTIEKDQCFPLYFYTEDEERQFSLFDDKGENNYIRHDAISNFILDRAKEQYGPKVNKEDLFFYVYGILHLPSYRQTFEADLKKMLPRIPLVESPQDFWAFSKAGRQLAALHLKYETVEPYPCTLNKDLFHEETYRVEKMRFPKKGEKTSIIFNNYVTICDIPAEAYEYQINGKSAIEWVMERYAVTQDPKSGIYNNPNDWADEQGNPKYIFDLLLSVINVSVQTVQIVKSLPQITFE